MNLISLVREDPKAIVKGKMERKYTNSFLSIIEFWLSLAYYYYLLEDGERRKIDHLFT
jgi:hypothetical protein